MNDRSLEKALEDLKRAEYERHNGYKPVYRADAWPDPLSLRDFPNGKTAENRFNTATFTDEER